MVHKVKSEEWMKLPKISKRDVEILKYHQLGKKHNWIMNKFGVDKKYIEKLLFKTGRGYRVG